jgi:hypothetical protein
MRYDIPDILKVQLVDDWENITRENMVRTHYLSYRTFILTASRPLDVSFLFRIIYPKTFIAYQLVPLPREPSVADTLDSFEKWALSQPETAKLPRASQLLPTVTAGLKLYFDRALGMSLLYRFERLQYSDIRKKYVTGSRVGIGQEREMSTIYGAEHLLRMIGER